MRERERERADTKGFETLEEKNNAEREKGKKNEKRLKSSIMSKLGKTLLI